MPRLGRASTLLAALDEDPRLISWLFWGFGLALVLPIWAGSHFPTEDGMAHLYWVDVFRQLGRAGSPWEPFYHRTAEWNTPNLSYFAIQYALSAVLEAHLAEQVFLTLLLACWIGAIHFLSTSLNGRVSVGAMASLLLFHSSWLYGGFFSLLIGIPILLLSLGLLVRAFAPDRPPPDAARFGRLALLGVAGYYSHLVAAGLFLVLCGAFALFYVRQRKAQVWYLAAAATPTLLLAWSYPVGPASGLDRPQWLPIWKSAAKFFGQAYFRGFGNGDWLFWLALALFEAILIALCLSILPPLRDGTITRLRLVILAIAGGLTVLYFALPNRVGEGGNFTARLQFAMWAWLLPALPFRMSPRARGAVLAAVCLLLSWQVVDFTGRARRFNLAYEEVLDRARAVPEGATLRSVLDYENAGFEHSFIRVLAHSAEDLGYHRRAVVVQGYHPARSFYWVGLRPTTDSSAQYLTKILPGPPSGLALTLDTVAAPAAGSARSPSAAPVRP